MKINDVFEKTSTITVTDYNEETQVVTAVNDVGAIIIMTKRQVDSMYTEKELNDG